MDEAFQKKCATTMLDISFSNESMQPMRFPILRFLLIFPAIGICCFSHASALTFSAWQATKFTTEELADLEISGPNADPDGDGRKNLIEYAYGLDPLVADQDESTSAVGPNGLTLTYPEVVAATDILYHLAESPDLMHWITPNTTTRTVLADDGTMRLVSIFNPNAPAAPLKWFNRLQVLITPDGTESLAAPTRVDAKVEVPLRLKIGWNDNTKIETGFAVERRVGTDGPWEEIGTVGADTSYFRDLDIVPLTQYTYRVSAIQGEYASDYSSEFTITAPADTDGDGIPDDMESMYNTDLMMFSSGNNGVPDAWWIFYGLDPYSSTTQDTDGDGRTDVQEYFDGTDPLVFDSAPTAPAPLAASDLTLTTLDNGHNELTWTNNDTPVGNIIERNQGGPTWQTVGIVSGMETTFTDATSLPDIVYFYRVTAYN